LDLVERLRDVADRLRISLAALSVAWTLAIRGVTGAIVGARSPEQVDGWVPGARVLLSEATLEEIEAAIALSGAGDESSAVVPLSVRAD
jgi:aryl-alcohol dehydrogenase-like predicted oxidoreductase